MMRLRGPSQASYVFALGSPIYGASKQEELEPDSFQARCLRRGSVLSNRPSWHRQP